VSWRLGLVGLFVGAALVRLVYVAIVGQGVAEDSGGYLRRARTLATTPDVWLQQIGADQAPLLSILLAPLSLAWPGHVAAAFLVAQAALGGVIAVAVAVLTRWGWGMGAGVWAGVAAALLPEFVFWSAYVLSDIVYVAALAVCGLQFARACSGAHPFRDGCVTAILFIAVVALRRAGLLFGVAIPIALWAALWAWPAARWRASLGFLLPLATGVGALLARNWLAAGEPLPEAQRLALGWSIWLPVWAGLQWTEAGRMTAGVDLQLPAGLRTMSGVALEQMLREETLRAVFERPGEIAALAARKAVVLWSPVLPGWSPRHALISGLSLVPLYAAALLGAWTQPVRPGPRAFAMVTILVPTVTSMVTFVDFDQRYRLPALLGVLVFAGAGLDRVAGWRGAARLWRLRQ
jgi:hypothetical protein